MDYLLIFGSAMALLIAVKGTVVSDDSLILFISLMAISALYEALTGITAKQGTLGKMLMRTTVVRTDQSKISFAQGLLRGIIKWASFPIWMIYFFFLFPSLNNLKPAAKMTTLHDLFSATRVKARKTENR